MAVSGAFVSQGQLLSDVCFFEQSSQLSSGAPIVANGHSNECSRGNTLKWVTAYIGELVILFVIVWALPLWTSAGEVERWGLWGLSIDNGGSRDSGAWKCGSMDILMKAKRMRSICE